MLSEGTRAYELECSYGHALAPQGITKVRALANRAETAEARLAEAEQLLAAAEGWLDKDEFLSKNIQAFLQSEGSSTEQEYHGHRPPDSDPNWRTNMGATVGEVGSYEAYYRSLGDQTVLEWEYTWVNPRKTRKARKPRGPKRLPETTKADPHVV